MFDDDLFDHLTPRDTIEIILDGAHIPRTNKLPVVLVVKYCGRGTPYWNAITKFKPLADVDAATERAATAFAKLGVVDWKNVVGKDGKPIPYTWGGCAEILHKLVKADRIDKVDNAIARAMMPDNYIAQAPEATDLGNG